MADSPSKFAPLRPLFLVKTGTMTRRDINRAERLCGVCIVECNNPDEARYSEAPINAGLDVQAVAALSLMRMVLRSQSYNFTRGDLTKWFVDMLMGERAVLVAPVQDVKKGR